MLHSVLLALALSGQIADGSTTCAALSRGLVEANPLLSGSCSVNLAKKALIISPALVFALHEKSAHPKISKAVLLTIGAVGMAAAWHNARVMR